ncbi:MAG: hypothetical protein PVF59_00310 [Desulfobacterales bacterium]|jgi:hypothetical protein
MKTMRRAHMGIGLLLCGLWACAATDRGIYRNVGRTTKPHSRITLNTAGDHQERWQTNDIAIDFSYQREADLFAMTGMAIQMSGKVELQQRLYNFPVISYLRIWMHFLDEEGLILSTHRLWTASRHTDTRLIRFNFRRQYPLPPNATMLTFSYTGEMTDGGGRRGPGGRTGDRVDWSFWWTP